MNTNKCLFAMIALPFSLYSMQNFTNYYDPIINRIPVQGSIVLFHNLSDKTISSFLCKERIYDLPDSFSVVTYIKKTFLLQGDPKRSLLGKMPQYSKLENFMQQKDTKNMLTAAWIAINLHTDNSISYEYCYETHCQINKTIFFQRSYTMNFENAPDLIAKAKEIFATNKVNKLLYKS